MEHWKDGWKKGMFLAPKMYMAKENDFVSVKKTIRSFPVPGIIISMFLFCGGYYLQHLADYARYGKLGYISSAVVLLISACLNIWNSGRKKMDISPQAKKSLSDLQDMSWREFEEYVWSLFSKLGYSIDSKNDPLEAGADLKISRDGKTSLVRCRKYYVRKVPFAMLNEFCGAVDAEPSLEKGYFITTGFFTREARKFAAGKPIELIDGRRLMDFVRIADSIDSVQERLLIHNSPLQEESLCTRCGASVELLAAGSEVSSQHLFRECSLSPECKGGLRKE